MTNKEAIYELNMMKRMVIADSVADRALDLALKALEERPTGRWISEDFDDWYCCSSCLKGDTYFDGLPNFCPNCGADMRGDRE